MRNFLPFLIFSLSFSGFTQTPEIDSLRNIVETTDSDTTKINALYEWDNLIYLSNPKLDNEINLQIVDICESNLRAQKKLSAAEIDFYKNHLSNGYNVLGINQDDLGNYSEALDFYYKAIWVSERRGDQEKISSIQNNIGLIHEKLEDYNLAIKFYRKSLKGVREAENKSGEVNALNNIGSVKLNQKDLDSSLYYYKEALKLAKTHEFDYYHTATLANIGVAFERLEMKDSALYYYYEAKPKLEELGDWDGLSNIYYNIGTIYLEWGDGKKAIEFCEQGYAIANVQDADFRKSINCNCLFDAYSLLGKSDSALKYYILADSIEYKFTNLETTREIARKDQAFEFKKEKFEDSLAFANEIEIRNAEQEKVQAQNKFRITLLLGGLGLIVLIWMFVYYRLRVAKKQKSQIEKQEAITRQQKELIAKQKEEIEQSINYAQLIQEATLPVKPHTELFTDSFILYLPKDVVSGDFYWLEEENNEVYFSVADCTGHGIPGAFISMIGTILLNEIYNSKKLRSPALILDELNRLVQLTLMSHNHQMKDGMDVSFCKLNKNTSELSFAGANNPVWFISDRSSVKASIKGEDVLLEPNLEKSGVYLYEVKADKQPVGKYHDVQQPFNLSVVQLQKGDKIYLFSDGFPDQFGGENWKKFKYKPFKKLFLDLYLHDMQSQRNELEKVFNNWKGEYEQIDDVCVIGVTV